jgi:hypothetical protein
MLSFEVSVGFMNKSLGFDRGVNNHSLAALFTVAPRLGCDANTLPLGFSASEPRPVIHKCGFNRGVHAAARKTAAAEPCVRKGECVVSS